MRDPGRRDNSLNQGSRKVGKYLARLGYGSRREMEALFRQKRVQSNLGESLSFDDLVGGSLSHAKILVDGETLDAPPDSVVLLNKPPGYVCSTVDTNPVVYDLLPVRFSARTPPISPIGRLDLDTSGLLLLSDDGKLNHRITSPRSHLAKVYDVTLASPLRGDEVQLFASGTLELHGENDKLMPAVLEIIADTEVRVTIVQGRYHQIRRMFAAAGNHVTSLHRAAIGGLTLGDLPEGSWRLLSEQETQSIFA